MMQDSASELGPDDRSGGRRGMNQHQHETMSTRGQNVFVRSSDEIMAMSWDQRIITKFRSFFRIACCGKDVSSSNEGQDCTSSRLGMKRSAGGASQSLQYRLEATRKQKKRNYFKYILSCGLFDSSSSGDGTLGINPNQQLAMYLHWMFRVNFLFLFTVMCALFFAWVVVFAAFITIAGAMDKECVKVGDQDFGSVNTRFADAFALSWTTFSTVGYGSTYPALGSEHSSSSNCFFITFICSLESLLGVLYSGFCGAILFGKVLRIQSHAQVLFSDPIVIRYGSGVTTHEFDSVEKDEDSGNRKMPFPVLEFRIVNRLFNDVGGEIMDATLNVVANVDANDADPMMMSDGIPSGDISLGKNTMDSTASYQGSNFGSNNNEKPTSGRGSHEDPSSKLVSRRIFSKMMIEASEHPFFKRVWLARHILDDSSPILKPKVRRQIRRNGGSWPDNLDSYEHIRESLQFNQILVSLNGVSNVSASDVYAQKIYDFVDVNVGYQFVNILYRDTDGVLKVDTDLLNDVREQRGGKGEPLIVGE